MSDFNRVRIQNIIESQIPEFLNTESPLFMEFLTQYYISQEHPTGIADLAANLDRLKDLKTYNNELFLTQAIPSLLTTEAYAFDPTIKVSHTIGFPERDGLVKIDDEIIYYKYKTANTFEECARGFSGIDTIKKSLDSSFLNFSETAAEEHNLGTTVQNLSLVFYQELFTKFKSQFLPGFENRNFLQNLKIGNILSRAVDFYSSKGTDQSYKILFFALFGEDISLIKPQDYQLRPSDDNFFITQNVLLEKVSGSDPLLLDGKTLFQDNNVEQGTSGAIYSVEYRPVDEKDLYEVYLDSTSIISEFKSTKKTNLSRAASVGDSILYVDNTIGFPDSGTLTTKDTSGRFQTISFTSRTNTQLRGVTGISAALEVGDEVFETNFVYTFDDNGDKVEFRLINVIGEVDTSQSSNLVVGDKIRLSSFGSELGDEPEFSNWIYNVRTNHQIKSISQSGSSTGNVYRVELYDNVLFYLDQDLLLWNPDISNDPETPCIVESIIDKNIIEVSCNQNVLNKTVLKKIVISGKSDANHTPSINDIPVGVQNTYISKDNKNFYVAASGAPNYTLFAKHETVNTSIATGIGVTNVLDTDRVHKFYTGEQIFYSPGVNSGIRTGIYHVTAVGPVKDSKKIKLSLSKSDLYSGKYVEFDTVTNDSFVKLDFENKTVENQLLLKKFNLIKGDSSLKQVASRSTNNRQVGILVNGVEIYSPTLFDENVYYGKIESIQVTNPGSGYDVINPPELVISDVSGKNAKGYLNISGSLDSVKIVTPGVGYQRKPKITLVGGNGVGAVVEPNLVRQRINSGFKGDGSGINPATNIITFPENHTFDDGEIVTYNANSNAEIQPLKTNSNYFVGVLSPTQIKLYESETNAYNRTNEINLSGISSGFHSFTTINAKNTITQLYVKNGGTGYANKITRVPSVIAFDGTTNGVNTFDDYIYAHNHSFKNKDIVRYSTTETPIGGLSTTTEYMVTVLDEDKFKLSGLGTGTQQIDVNFTNRRYVGLSSLGIGTHTFSYPPIRLEVESLSGVSATTEIQPQFEPIILGSVESVFLEDSGVGYGVSNIINFHRRPDIQIANIQSEALLRPIVVNGSIVDVQFLTFGRGYDKGIDIVVTGRGSYADIRPVVENGRIVAVNIANGGIGYSKDDTEISIVRRGIDARFLGNVTEWKINQVEKNKELLKTSDEGIIAPSKNKDLGLQLVNFYTPKIIRKTLDDHIDSSDREVANNVHSPIIGWAYDGNPIYGPYGQVGSDFRRVRSSYAKRVEPNTLLRPPGFSDGFFLQDYYFDRAIGDLDENNGRFCKPPEFPDGVYAYFSTIDNNAISNPEFPYLVGNEFRDYVITDNYATTFTQSSLDNLDVIRNIGPYYVNSQFSSYDLISNNAPKYLQEFTVTKTLASEIDSVQIYAPGTGYKVKDNIVFDNANTDGSGASAAVSRIRGKDVASIDVGISTSYDVSFVTSGKTVIGIAQTPHGLLTGERIEVSAISNSTYASSFNGIKRIAVPQKTVGLSSDIDQQPVTGNVTTIGVNEITGFFVDDFIAIGDETLKILRIDSKNSEFTVHRLTNTGVHTVGIDSVRLLPTTFEFNEDSVPSAIKQNKIVYFPSKSLIGFGSEGSDYTLEDGTNLHVPERAIYIKQHNFFTGQPLKYAPGVDGTNLLVSDTPDPNQTFQLPGNVYAVNLGTNYVGLSTLGYTTSTGIGTNLNSLFFYDDTPVTGAAHSLTTNYDKVIGKVESFNLDIVTISAHELLTDDKIKFNILPLLSDTFKLRYDTVIRKATTELIEFDGATGVYVSDNEIHFANNNFKTGDKIVYYAQGNSALPGLEDNRTYYIIKEKPDFIKLANFYSDAISGTAITITGTSSGDHGIALVNPPIIGTKGNSLKFDLSDTTLSGMDLKLYKDSDLLIELESYRYIRNSKNAGSPGALLTVDTTDKNITNTLFYALIPFAANIIEKTQISIDKEVVGNNKITLRPSIYNNTYKVVSTGTTSFKFNLLDKPEYFSYSATSGISTIFYDTDSANASGPISKIKLNFGGRGYKRTPRIASIDTKSGKNAILKATSTKVGQIDFVERVKDGFDYPTDPTLAPVLSVPTVCQVKDIARVDGVGITTGGSGYNTPPRLKVIGNDLIQLQAIIEGGSVSKVNIIQNVTNLSEPLRVVPIRNSNGFDIDDIVYNSSTNDVTLELVNADNQIYPLISNAQGSTYVDFPFKIGDEIFVENCRISDADTKENYNSSEYGYRFFTVTGISTTNFTVTYSMNNIGTNLGEYNADNGYGMVINKSKMADFEMTLADDLAYLSGEDVVGYNANNVAVFSGKVMESGWDNRINQLRIIDSKGDLEAGNKLLGTRSRLFGTIENSNQFNLTSRLTVTREKINDFQDRTGYLNDYQQRISDNEYYQKFSYAIKSELPYDEWKESVRSLVHPAGFKEFSDLDVVGKASNHMKVGVGDSSLNINISIDNVGSMYSRNNFSMVTEDETLPDGSIERVIFPDGVNLKSFILSQSNKVILVDDVSSQFTGLTSSIGGGIVGLTTFKLETEGFPLFYREFAANDAVTVDLTTDTFKIEKHNFQSGQKLIYDVDKRDAAPNAEALNTVDVGFSYPTLPSTFDSPVVSFDSSSTTFDTN